MTASQFVFVQALPLGRTKREQELDRAKALSHAAKAVHRRGKDTRRDSQRQATVLSEKHGLDLVKRLRQESSDEDDDFAHSFRSIPPERQKTVAHRRWTSRDTGFIPAFLSLRQGNSDPFRVFPIAISSNINAFMQYTRELYLPGLVRDALNQDAKVAEESQEWADCVSALEDPVTAYAHLARIAAAMTPFDESFGMQLLIFKSKGTELLRQRIANGEINHKTMLAMSCLHLAANHAREYTAARSHAKALIQLFQRGDVPIDRVLLYRTVAQHGQMVSTTLERPSFDVEGWLSEIMAQELQPLIDALPPFISFEAVSEGIDTSIEDARLRNVLGKLRQGLGLFMVSALDPTYATFDYKQLIRYVVNSSLMIIVNVYLDAKTWLDQSHRTSPRSERGYFHAQAYASLATILWLRKGTGASDVGLAGAPPLFDANPLLMSRLKQVLTESEWMVSDEAQSKKYATVRLWAIYVGAYQEQADVVDAGSHRSASRDWFNVELALHAKEMGLVTWEQVREPLLGFMHADILTPHGSTWFMQTLDANVVENFS